MRARTRTDGRRLLPASRLCLSRDRSLRRRQARAPRCNTAARAGGLDQQLHSRPPADEHSRYSRYSRSHLGGRCVLEICSRSRSSLGRSSLGRSRFGRSSLGRSSLGRSRFGRSRFSRSSLGGRDGVVARGRPLLASAGELGRGGGSGGAAARRPARRPARRAVWGAAAAICAPRATLSEAIRKPSRGPRDA